jgi:AmmeMemoRadiSam system protein A
VLLAYPETMQTAGPSANSPVALAVLMPHAPVLVEPVGGRRIREVAGTVAAMQRVARRVVETKPDAVVVISPHSPRRSGAFGIWTGPLLEGSFDQFGAPEAIVTLPDAQELSDEIAAQIKARKLATWEIAPRPLDHGALVPLWFLGEAGWKGPTVVISLNYPHEGGLFELGDAITQAARQRHERVAVVASGDMSHALQPGAPCGFHPRAKDFDHQFIDLLRAGRIRETGELDPDLQELASEDVVDSTLIAGAAARWRTDGHEVLSYEGPFGVGYGVAVLFDANQLGKDGTGESLPRLARESVESSFLSRNTAPTSDKNSYLARQHGVFVTLHRRSGELRGCVGTLLPKWRDVLEETWHMAREAAFNDGRFPPLKEHELAEVIFEVSVIHDLEPVDSLDDLDPARYGVLLTTPDGRRAALLPGIPEIKSVDEQLRIARQKGRIGEDESVRIQRFLADHFEETN